MSCRLPAACALLLALLAGGAEAADPGANVGRRAHALSGDLMSPYCPGRTLADCPSPEAAVVREEIRARLGRGESESEVRALLESRFGEGVRGLPREAIGWAGPVVILVTGAALLALALRALSRRGVHGAAPRAPTDLEEELDAEIRRRGL
jgi:cytochrome c-type biogenesis protein CcmH/NrfF